MRLIDQGDRAVLHLGRRIALGVDVADLLQLQRAFQGGGEIELPAEIEEVVALGVFLRDLAHVVVALERLADLVGQFLELVDDFHAGREAQMPQPAEIEGQHRQQRALRGERLGRGHADFRSRAEIEAAVGFLGDGAADDVADAQRRAALAFHFAQGRQRVGRLAALRDGEHQRVVVQRRIAIAQLAGVFDFDRQPGEGLDLVLAHQAGVPTGAAAGDDDAAQRAELLRREVEAAELRRGGVAIEPAAHDVFDRLGLLEDLLEHEVVEAALGDVARLKSSTWTLWLTWP